MKGVCGPLAGDTPRIGTKRQIGSRNLWENAKRQVWNRILKREESGVVHIHVCLDVGAYLNGHLHYPNDIDKSLNESVTDKIRSIELTAIITPLRLSLLCLLLPVRLGGYTVNLCDFYSYRIHMSHQSSRLEAGFQSTLSQFRETDQENGVGTVLDLFRTRSCVFQE
jgi:hypothetical protein